jgi:hypothetical protein
MLTRRLPERVYLRLKGAFGDLLHANGGGVDAAKRTRLQQPDLSRFQSTNPEHALRFAPIDVVADLEQFAGEPYVTRLLAELNNCLLVPLPEGMAEGALAERTGKSAKEFGDVMVRIGEALRDGEISEDEASSILREIREVMLELSALAEAVRAATKREDADG